MSQSQLARFFAASVLALVAPVASPVLPAEAVATTSVSGWPSTGTSGAVGYTLTSAVRVKTGTGYVARRIALQRRSSATTAWSTITTATTTATGTYTASYAIPATGIWYFGA